MPQSWLDAGPVAGMDLPCTTTGTRNVRWLRSGQRLKTQSKRESLTLAAAIASQRARDRVAARRRKREDLETAHRREEEAMISSLKVELRALRATDRDMSLLTAVEYITPDPGRRVALYKGCHAQDHSTGAAKDLALLERRARVEGFHV